MPMKDLLPIWLIEPALDRRDAGWEGRYIWQKILVREESEHAARKAADAWMREREAGKLGPKQESGLTDETLYRIKHLPVAAEEMLEFAGVERGVLDVEG